MRCFVVLKKLYLSMIDIDLCLSRQYDKKVFRCCLAICGEIRYDFLYQILPIYDIFFPVLVSVDVNLVRFCHTWFSSTRKREREKLAHMENFRNWSMVFHMWSVHQNSSNCNLFLIVSHIGK